MYRSKWILILKKFFATWDSLIRNKRVVKFTDSNVFKAGKIPSTDSDWFKHSVIRLYGFCKFTHEIYPFCMDTIITMIMYTQAPTVTIFYSAWWKLNIWTPGIYIQNSRSRLGVSIFPEYMQAWTNGTRRLPLMSPVLLWWGTWRLQTKLLSNMRPWNNKTKHLVNSATTWSPIQKLRAGES